MSDHSQLSITENYISLLETRINGRMQDQAKMFDPATTTATNIPTSTIRWSSASNKFEKWSGTAWSDLSALYAINISGNAATVTNGIYSTGTYANPSWITSLAYSKLTGTVPIWNQSTTGNAATVTNGVYSVGNQNIDGIKTFTQAPVVPDYTFALNKLQNVAQGSILGRVSSGTGAVEQISKTQAAQMLGGVPAGAVMYFATANAPVGWLVCDGSLVSQTTYPDLYAAIGGTFGIPPVGQFKLPDLRSEFIRGHDQGRGVDTGRVFGSSQTDSFKSHNHDTNVLSSGFGVSGANATYSEGSTLNIMSASTGGTETRPRNVALLACIKY